jgi:hypothetical protein
MKINLSLQKIIINGDFRMVKKFMGKNISSDEFDEMIFNNREFKDR